MKNCLKQYIPIILTLITALTASAQGFVWAHWTAANTNVGTASGTLGVDTVSETGALDLYTQINNYGTNNYWTPASTFTNGVAKTIPDTTDALRFAGGSNFTYTLTFAQPVTNLVLSLFSLGSWSLSITNSLTFSDTFTLLSSGGDFWSPTGYHTYMAQTATNVITGVEGSGSLLFAGTISSLSWTTERYENDAGFTVGALVVPEPAPVALLGFGGLALLYFRSRIFKK